MIHVILNKWENANSSKTQTFDVIVYPVNDVPTLDAIDDLTIDEDAPEQTVELSGITAGGGELQPQCRGC